MERELNVFDVVELVLMGDLLNRHAEKLVAIRLLKYDSFMSGKEISFSQRYLCNHMKIGRSSFFKALRRLEELALIYPCTKSKGRTTKTRINWYACRLCYKHWKGQNGGPLMRQKWSPHETNTSESVSPGDRKEGRPKVLPTLVKDTRKTVSHPEMLDL